MTARNPTTLEELDELLCRATRAAEVFGDEPSVRYCRLARLCHPDLFRVGPDQIRARRVFQKLTEWLERARSETSLRVIVSPKRKYTLIRQLGSGDVADVCLATADGQNYVIKSARSDEGNAFLASEARVLHLLRKRCGDRRYADYLPRVVETFSIREGHTELAINVFSFREGFFTLDSLHEQHPTGLDARHLAWIFKRMLAVLGLAHTCGLVHGAILPPHALAHAKNHGLLLLDWIHAVPIGEVLKFVPTRYRTWYPSEVFYREGTSPGLDIFLAAQCMKYLSGGDPQAEEWPDFVPFEMQRFFNTCLFAAPKMRPQNAWDLHEQFDELLRQLFGSPKYHPLVMS